MMGINYSDGFIATIPLYDAETDVHVVNEPTCIGDDLFAVSLIPKLPDVLYPHAHNDPSVLIAAVCPK